MLPELNKTYKLYAKNEIIATLIKIETYPATGMPPDYIFRHVTGDNSLCGLSRICDADCFPLPEGLFNLIKYEEIDPLKEEPVSENCVVEIAMCKDILARIKREKALTINENELKIFDRQEKQTLELLQYFTEKAECSQKT